MVEITVRTDVETEERTPLERLEDATRARIEQLRAVRNAGIDAGAPHTFDDGTRCVLPMAVPGEATRMTALVQYARELVDDGRGDQPVLFEDVTGADFERPAMDLVRAIRSAGERAQAWHGRFVQHKANVRAIAADTTKSVQARINEVRAYDPAERGGWPG